MIAVVAPFNPNAVADFLSENNVLKTNTSATSVNNMIRCLIEHNQKVCVFTTSSAVLKDKVITYQSPYIKIYVIGVKSNLEILTKFPSIKKIAKSISNVIKKEINNISIIHCHWTYEFAYACLPFKSEKKVFCTIRDVAPIICRSIPINLKLSNIVNKVYWIYKTFLQTNLLKKANYNYIANSVYTKNIINSIYKINNISIVPNSIETELILQDAPKQKCRHTFITITSSVDIKRKNILTLLRAFIIYKEKHQDAKLNIIGAYNKNRAVYKYVKKNNLLKSVIFYGPLERERIITLIDQSSCMVHPATEETFGNTLLEGMARNIPIIGGESSGAVPEVLGFGKYGILCNVLSPEQIYEKMELVNDETYTAKIIRQASDSVIRKYSNNAIYKKYKMIYNI